MICFLLLLFAWAGIVDQFFFDFTRNFNAFELYFLLILDKLLLSSAYSFDFHQIRAQEGAFVWTVGGKLNEQPITNGK